MYSFTKTIAAATLAAAVSYPIMANENNIINSDNDSFQYVTDRFADIEVLRYRVPGFEDLTINQKKLIYYLTEAAIWGRDILWDQNGNTIWQYEILLRMYIQIIQAKNLILNTNTLRNILSRYGLAMVYITIIQWINSRLDFPVNS